MLKMEKKKSGKNIIISSKQKVIETKFLSQILSKKQETMWTI